VGVDGIHANITGVFAFFASNMLCCYNYLVRKSHLSPDSGSSPKKRKLKKQGGNEMGSKGRKNVKKPKKPKEKKK